MANIEFLLQVIDREGILPTRYIIFDGYINEGETALNALPRIIADNSYIWELLPQYHADLKKQRFSVSDPVINRFFASVEVRKAPFNNRNGLKAFNKRNASIDFELIDERCSLNIV